MSTEIMEREEQVEPTPEPTPEKVEEVQESAPEKAEGTEQTQTQAEVEIEGEKVSVAQLKEWREAATNKAEWQKSNTLKAQEIARERKELAEAKILYDALKSDPQRLQKILSPEPARDFDAEIKAVYQKMQSATEDPQAFWSLNQQKDSLIAEKAATEAYNKARQQTEAESTKRTNDQLVQSAYEKYHGELSDDEFKAMTEWIVENVKATNNVYPKYAYDIAHSVLYGSKAVEKAKIEASKSVARSIEKAKPASGDTGKLKQPDKEPLDDEDDAFVNAIHERHAPIKR